MNLYTSSFGSAASNKVHPVGGITGAEEIIWEKNPRETTTSKADMMQSGMHCSSQ